MIKEDSSVELRYAITDKVCDPVVPLQRSELEKGKSLEARFANVRGHPNLRGANPRVRFSPFVDFFGF